MEDAGYACTMVDMYSIHGLVAVVSRFVVNFGSCRRIPVSLSASMNCGPSGKASGPGYYGELLSNCFFGAFPRLVPLFQSRAFFNCIFQVGLIHCTFAYRGRDPFLSSFALPISARGQGVSSSAVAFSE